MKALAVAVWGGVVLWVGIIGAMLYTLIVPYRVLGPFPLTPRHILTPIVPQGGILLFQPEGCKRMPLQAEIVRSFVDGLVFTMPAVKGTATVGCPPPYPVAVQVPATLPPGQYHLRTHLTYTINHLRTVEYEFNTETFTVSERD